jgi:hypothetical protein
VACCVDRFGPADLRAFLLSTDAAIRAGFVPDLGESFAMINDIYSARPSRAGG